MPKEGNHLKGEGDKGAKEERTQDSSSEETAGQRGQLVESFPQGEEWASLTHIEQGFQTYRMTHNIVEQSVKILKGWINIALTLSQQ